MRRNLHTRLSVARYLACAGVLAAVAAAPARADYIVLQSGERIHVDSYEVEGSSLRMVVTGGTMEIPMAECVRIDPEDTFTPVRIKALDVPYAKWIAASARAHGLPPELVASVIAVESNFNPNAVSWRSARGLMQLLPQTAARFGVTNLFDPQQNIEAGTKYLKQLLVHYKGDLALSLAAYNAGPERVEQYRNIPPYRETRDYVRRVTEKFRATGASLQLAELR